MRRVPSVLREVLLAAALAQSALPAALVVVDELRRSDRLAPSHVDAPGTSHDYRAHEHDCVACQQLRAPALPVRRVSSHAIGSGDMRPLSVGRTFTARERGRDTAARAPPVERI